MLIARVFWVVAWQMLECCDCSCYASVRCMVVARYCFVLARVFLVCSGGWLLVCSWQLNRVVLWWFAMVF